MSPQRSWSAAKALSRTPSIMSPRAQLVNTRSCLAVQRLQASRNSSPGVPPERCREIPKLSFTGRKTRFHQITRLGECNAFLVLRRAIHPRLQPIRRSILLDAEKDEDHQDQSKQIHRRCVHGANVIKTKLLGVSFQIRAMLPLLCPFPTYLLSVEEWRLGKNVRGKRVSLSSA